MIISRQNGKLVMVRQDDHMYHAGEMAQRWGNEFFGKPTPNESVCKAIGLHDIGWKEYDDQLPFDPEKKGPVNFTEVDLRKHVEFYGKGYQQVLEEDRYAGLLVGMHWIGLYTRRFGYDPSFTYETTEALRPFMEETINQKQKEWVDFKQDMWNSKRQTRSEFEDKIWMHYELFQVMDRLSLFICMNDPNKSAETKLGPVRFTLKGEPVYLDVRLVGDAKVTVDPFPFDKEFEVSLPACKIPDSTYASQDDLTKAYQSASEEAIKCKILSS